MISFKQYREESKGKLDSLETCFGKHSIGKASLVSEDIIPTKKTSYEKYAPKDNDLIHNKIASGNAHDEDEEDAITDYSDDSRPLNSMLHMHDKGHDISGRKNAAYHDNVEKLDKILSRHQTTEDMTVFTGLKSTPARHFKSEGDKPEKTTRVHLPAYTSTSSQLRSAHPFAEPTMHYKDERHGVEYDENDEARHVLKIHVPKGTNAMSIKKYSFCPEEDEVLLHRGHDIEIHHKPERLDRNTYIWHAKIVGHNPKKVK